MAPSSATASLSASNSSRGRGDRFRRCHGREPTYTLLPPFRAPTRVLLAIADLQAPTERTAALHAQVQGQLRRYGRSVTASRKALRLSTAVARSIPRVAAAAPTLARAFSSPATRVSSRIAQLPQATMWPLSCCLAILRLLPICGKTPHNTHRDGSVTFEALRGSA
jgi:hypothetical protein